MAQRLARMLQGSPYLVSWMPQLQALGTPKVRRQETRLRFQSPEELVPQVATNDYE
jgi:hypothetical protein